jgi:hypothetical protein
MSQKICEVPKNSRQSIVFSLGEFNGHKFADLRLYALEDGKDPASTKKGLTVSPALWRQFREALLEVEAAMIESGWIDREDLE